jgi:hypothetical protein
LQHSWFIDVKLKSIVFCKKLIQKSILWFICPEFNVCEEKDMFLIAQ